MRHDLSAEQRSAVDVTHWPGGLPERTSVVWRDGVPSDTSQPRNVRSVVAVGRWESPDGAVAVVLPRHH